MNIKPFFPSRTRELSPPNHGVETNEVSLPTLKKKTNLGRLFKVASKALSVNNSGFNLSVRTNIFEEPEYDFEQIMQAIDTDSYCQQAFNKYQELMWKSGWEIVGENEEAVTYLKKRIALIEATMNRPFTSFLKDVTDHFVKFHNAFIVKHRADIQQYLTHPIDTYSQTNPIIGYYLIPPQTVSVQRNNKNIPLAYKQRLDSNIGFGRGATEDPKWKADDVIHIHANRKTGHIYGTPFVVAVLDDIISLRSMEQDILNLSHRELFPILKYMLTDVDQDDPAAEVIDQIIDQLENMRTEGSLLLPPGHDVGVVGSEGEALDVSDYLNHFKERVAAGLGVFPHHLGMVSFAGGNRDMTDRLDQALYDRIKSYQREIERSITFYFFNELLLDGGFDPYSNLTGAASDSCRFRFKEIDTDAKVKEQSHILSLFTGGLYSRAETRVKLGELPEIDEEDTIQVINAKIALRYTPTPSVDPLTNKQTPSTGGSRNPKNLGKGTGNQVRPQNQNGRNTSPNIRQSDKALPIKELDPEEVSLIEWYLEDIKDDDSE